MNQHHYLYISETSTQDIITYTVLRHLDTLTELQSFIEAVQCVLEPLHALDNTQDSMLFYNYNANGFIDQLTTENKPLGNWYSLRNLDRTRQINYSIYTEEQFIRQQEHLKNMEREFIIK